MIKNNDVFSIKSSLVYISDVHNLQIENAYIQGVPQGGHDGQGVPQGGHDGHGVPQGGNDGQGETQGVQDGHCEKQQILFKFSNQNARIFFLVLMFVLERN